MTVPANRQEGLARYERKVKDRIYKDPDERKLAEILAYLRGETKEPVALTADDDYAFEGLASILAPLEAWSDLDHRVLEQLRALWCYAKDGKKRGSERGYYEGFYRWLGQQIATEGTTDRHRLARGHLVEHGVEEPQILRHTLDELSDVLLDAAHAPTSAGRFVLAHFPAAFETMLDVVLDKRMEGDLARLLARHRPDELESRIDDWLARTGPWGRFQLLKCLLAVDPERHEARALAALAALDERWPRFQLARALATHCGAAHHALARCEAEAQLTEISAERNEKKRDYSDSAWDSAQRAFSSKTPTTVDWLLTTFGAAARDVVHAYVVQTKQIDLYTLGVIADKLGQDALDTLAEGLDVPVEDKDDADYLAQLFRILDNVDWSAHYDAAWAFARHPSKPIRETVAAALGRQGSRTRAGALALCAEKKAELRQTGAMVLAGSGDAESLAALEALVADEKNDDVRDFALEALDAVYARQRREIDQATIEARFAKAKADKKLAKPVRPWLDEAKLPPLHWRDGGRPLGSDWTRYLLYRQARCKDLRSDIEARPLYRRIDRGRSGPFATAVLEAFVTSGENAKDRFCLGVAGLLGDDAVAQLLRAKTIAWADSGRGKMGEYSVHALALLGSDRALRAVGDFARRYQNKQKNVGAAAEAAFETAARELGIGPAELGDRLVPSFDFDEDRQRVFALDEEGQSRLTVRLGLDHRLTYSVDGKTTKSVPKAVPAAAKNELKVLAKELTEVVRAQAARLEEQLVIQRRWPARRWRVLFVQNAVLFPFAARQLWGAYDGEGRRTATLHAAADGALAGSDGSALELGDDAFVGLVHPLELDDVEREVWRAALAAHEHAPFFAQLDRETVTVDPAAAARTVCRDYEDREVGAGTFRRRAEKLGWQRGSVCDGGGITGYHKVFATAGIDVVLLVEGIGVQLDDYGKAKLGRLLFVRDGSVHYGSYVYDEPRQDSDPRLVPLGQVPPIVYSEALGNLATISAEQE